MPELPEVETICRGLELRIKNRKITEIETLNPKLRIAIPKDLNSKFKNKKILQVKRKAKYILIECESDLTLVIHLGMSGRILIVSDEASYKKKHNHLFIHLDNADTVILNDSRRFGLVTWTETSELDQHKLFSKLGIEPFSKEFTIKKLTEIFSKRKKSIKSVLMDSTLIVGVGNIYASEILFRSKIHPEHYTNTLIKKNIEAIHKHTLDVLSEAIADGASSLKDYTHADGNLGRFQHHFKVYGKTGKPCPVCKATIQCIIQNGRSTFFCSKCQKL